MEDDKLKSLFTNFEPELSSDFKFMNKLEPLLSTKKWTRLKIK